ncbi:MAG TPA: cupin domain-containing protein [Gaiellaceae bacterium]|nr:cupin domain-containing protein [Gaiellaceae bacterium]
MARENDYFRREVRTAGHSQIVLMTIPPGGEIGEEAHEGHDQLLVFVEGEGEAVLEGASSPVGAGDAVLVPDGMRHNFVNTGSGPLCLWTLYAPPEHAPGTMHETKAEADAAEA